MKLKNIFSRKTTKGNIAQTEIRPYFKMEDEVIDELMITLKKMTK